MRAADALFSSPSSAPARDRRPAEPAELQPPGAEPPAPEKNGGRILRVVDEAPLPQVAALEAERAPKRRGRKPGSKNKPKAALVSKHSEAADQLPSSTRASKIAPSTVTSPSAAPVARIEALVAASRAAKRPAWGRDRLRPGEDWKRRRLPRVCW